MTSPYPTRLPLSYLCHLPHHPYIFDFIHKTATRFIKNPVFLFPSSSRPYVSLFYRYFRLFLFRWTFIFKSSSGQPRETNPNASSTEQIRKPRTNFISDKIYVYSVVQHGSQWGPIISYVLLTTYICFENQSEFIMLADDIKLFESIGTLSDCSSIWP